MTEKKLHEKTISEILDLAPREFPVSNITREDIKQWAVSLLKHIWTDTPEENIMKEFGFHTGRELQGAVKILKHIFELTEEDNDDRENTKGKLP